jgi:hypothetical protein
MAQEFDDAPAAEASWRMGEAREVSFHAGVAVVFRF